MNKRFAILGLAALMGSIIAGGCTQKAQEKYDQAGEQIGKAADATGEAVATDAKVAGEHVENAAENAAELGDSAGTTMKVKNAIVAAEDLDSSDINVDTVDDKVYLKGSVKRASDKARAQKIAEGVLGGGEKLINEITVKAGS